MGRGWIGRGWCWRMILSWWRIWMIWMGMIILRIRIGRWWGGCSRGIWCRMFLIFLGLLGWMFWRGFWLLGRRCCILWIVCFKVLMVRLLMYGKYCWRSEICFLLLLLVRRWMRCVRSRVVLVWNCVVGSGGKFWCCLRDGFFFGMWLLKCFLLMVVVICLWLLIWWWEMRFMLGLLLRCCIIVIWVCCWIWRMFGDWRFLSLLRRYCRCWGLSLVVFLICWGGICWWRGGRRERYLIFIIWCWLILWWVECLMIWCNIWFFCGCWWIIWVRSWIWIIWWCLGICLSWWVCRILFGWWILIWGIRVWLRLGRCCFIMGCIICLWWLCCCIWFGCCCLCSFIYCCRVGCLIILIGCFFLLRGFGCCCWRIMGWMWGSWFLSFFIFWIFWWMLMVIILVNVKVVRGRWIMLFCFFGLRVILRFLLLNIVRFLSFCMWVSIFINGLILFLGISSVEKLW